MCGPNVILAIAVVTILFAAGLFDVYAYYFLPTGSTVSEVMTGWMRSMPIFGIVVGIVLGHLAWPQKPPVPPPGL